MTSGERPNILLVMSDQMSAAALPHYGHPLVRAPNLKALADTGIVFENAYCSAPLCVPSRYSMLTGKLPSRIGAYDNGAELASDAPTFVHHLRRAGYRTVLAGKMDFCGADQLHGYEERLNTDLTPADFGWTPDWSRPDRVEPWHHDMTSVAEAGPCRRTLAMDYDEEAAFAAARWIREAARAPDRRPFFMTLSFIHPHDPYLAPKANWDAYDGAAIDMPAVAPIPPEERDPHSRRLYQLYDRGEHRIEAAHVRAARRAYYAMIDYVDGLIGQALGALRETGQFERTAVIATADHGDMLGERGLWYKMTFFERAVRVPLVFTAPGMWAPRRVPDVVSLADLYPTLQAMAGMAPDGEDGTNLLPLIEGRQIPRRDAIFGEYMAEGTTAPIFMIRRGRHKYVAAEGDPPQLFDLDADPCERRNLADDEGHRATARDFAEEVAAKWDGAAIASDVRVSQRRRLLVQRALNVGRNTPWDFEPAYGAAGRYYRNRPEAQDIERRARIKTRGEDL